MEFSDLLTRCNLVYLSDYLANDGGLLKIPEDESFEETVRKAERALYRLPLSIKNGKISEDEAEDTIGISVSSIRRTFFEMGFIAGIKVTQQINIRAKELED